MSDRSGSPSDEGEGDEIRPYGEDRDSSEESSEEDVEEARRVAEGFIVQDEEDDDDEDDVDEDEDEEARRRRKRKERKRKQRRRERLKRREEELSEDELELLQENQGLAGPSSNRPLKRLKRREGEDDGDEEKIPDLQDIFRDDEQRRDLDDEDEDDLGDFIEEDEEEERAAGETEEQRRERRREEKLKRRQAAKARPDLAGLDRGAFDENYAVFGDGEEYEWAMEGEDAEYDEDEEVIKKDLRLEDVFDPAEIKARRLQDEDKAIAARDIPERHQLVNSTMSDNPVLAPDTLYPPPDIAAGWAYNKISTRTQYLFCGMLPDGSYPEPTPEQPQPYPAPRRSDLATMYVQTVSTALKMMFVENFEVPYLWHYKRDSFSILENHGQSSVQFLERDELWNLYDLGIRFRAIYSRCDQITSTWNKIKAKKPELENDYLTKTLLASTCMMSVEAAAEGYEWLAYHYPEEVKQIKEDEAIEEGLKRLPERSRGDDLRSGPVMSLVDAFGISVPKVAVVFNDPQGEPEPLKNSDRLPKVLAEEFCGPESLFTEPDDALNAAKSILVNDFAHDPSIRQQAREFVEACGTVTVTPTERGQTIIDQYHLYYTFKFLTNKPISLFKNSPQFLHILKAEEEGLIEMDINVGDEETDQFSGTLIRCVRSNDYGELATAWNALRQEICETVVTKHLVPAASKWAKEHMKSEAENYVAERCRMELEFRVNVRPYATEGMEPGETPSVLALTNGHGTIRDAVMAVFVDDEGNIRTQTKFDNLKDEADRDAFIELVEKRQPKVIVVGGLSVQAAKLRDDITAALRSLAIRQTGENPPIQETFQMHEDFQMAMSGFEQRLQPKMKPLIFVNDATARIYMTSEDANKENPNLPVNGRYALGLARYAQNPLNAYCKLGKHITSITFDEHHQKLISTEKLLVNLERGLVNAVCFMGIEINSCVADIYQRVMLPFIAGLGPRKADHLVNAVLRQGTLVNRATFTEPGFFGPTVADNSVGFLSIETDMKDFILEKENQAEQPDPLDLTRIHPEDYDLAQKMCQDALDLDAEDVADQHPSAVVLQLMQDDDRGRKLGELNLDDFAFNLQLAGNNKRHTLGEIVNELISYRADRRPQFYIPTDWEIVQMLSGETERTIGRGIKVTATVRRAMAARVFCHLESGMDAVLDREYVSDDDQAVISCEDQFRRGQSVRAVVIMPEPARMQVRISTRESELKQGVPFLQPFREEQYNDLQRQSLADEQAAQKKRRAKGSVKRVVNHPNWHVMNSGQAEQFLASQHRGDVVIRPSSKGADHLAVTWKVDEDVYQHIDVQEIDKPNEYSVGRILRVAGKYSYSDLDELIINHVKATARKFDEMQMHEKYRPEDELEGFLKNYVQAHPGRSMYGFSIDSEKPGYLKLCFLNKSTKDGGVIQTWSVKVLPGAYQLNNAEVPGVTELCNAFKAQYSSRLSEQGQGGKTPGIRAGRTPAGGRTPGSRTPAVGMRGGMTPAMGGMQGRTPIRPGMTPNPYGMPPQAAYGNGPPQGPGMGGYGRPPPGYPAGPGGPNGYPMPGPNGAAGGYPPPGAPMGSGMGMNPERAAMIARQGGGGGRY